MFCSQQKTALHELDDLARAGGTDAAKAVIAFKLIYQRLADTAPEPIRSDWATVNSAVQTIRDTNDLGALDQLPDQLYADTRISAWSLANCGYDPNNFSHAPARPPP